jgi:deoxyribonuclease V
MSWPRAGDELARVQDELAAAEPAAWHESAGSDVGACIVVFPRGKTGAGDAGDPAWAAATVVRGRPVVVDAVVTGEAGAPYAPGLLALREGPVLEAAVRALPTDPDVLLADATGRDHPRRAGLALHLGAVLDLPTVGVTHRPLLAEGDWPPDVAGARSPLVLEGEAVGAWLRTRPGTRPLAVHPAWRTDLDTAVEVVLAASGGHRTPEPLRRARRLARSAREAAGRAAECRICQPEADSVDPRGVCR